MTPFSDVPEPEDEATAAASDSRFSLTMSMSGSGVSRLAQLASSVPSGPRRPAIVSPSVFWPLAGVAHGSAHVDAGESFSSSCKYAMGFVGARHGGGMQL